jgi:hypothetical protein
MPKATSICNSIVGLMYRATPWANVADNASASPLTQVFLSFHTGNLTPATGTQTENETAYTNYSRKATLRSATDWTAPSAGGVSNATLQQFPACGVTGSTLSHCATGIASSGAGAVWHFGALNSALAVANGITPQFNIGALTIQES